jgi:AbiV family abortive infection protein
MDEKEKLSIATKAVCDNVEQYVKDAEALIGIKSYKHAYALLVLAIEELNKPALLTLLFRYPELNEAVRKNMTKHDIKQDVILNNEIAMEMFFGHEEYSKYLEGMQVKKLNALYVDLDKNREVINCPIKDDDVPKVLEFVKKILEYTKGTSSEDRMKTLEKLLGDTLK